MPKFFSDERPLLFPVTRLLHTEVTDARIQEKLQTGNNITFAIVFEGYHATCLGFVFNVRINGSQFELVNITGQTEIIANSLGALVQVIRHVSGIEYFERVQVAFQSSRNNIGHGSPLIHQMEAAMFAGG